MGEGVGLSRAAAGLAAPRRGDEIASRRAAAAGRSFPRPSTASPGGAALLWASVAALFLLLHPYDGLVQDARIYVGRGVADRHLGGIARDILFSDDGQTGFTILRPAVAALLGFASPAVASAALAFAGSLAWVAGFAALARRVAASCGLGPGAERAAWAMAVAAIALPSQYGGLGTFAYGEAIATPRVFAEAAAMAGLAGLVGGRHLAGWASLLLAAALHPLMALPALGLGGVLSARADRRWIAAGLCAAAAFGLAGALGLPVASRLFVRMDAVWGALLRSRSANIFPSLWSPDDFAHLAPRAASALVAGASAPPRVRGLLWGAVGVGFAGLALACLGGDAVQDLLITQLQPWRALWLLAVLGNASLALAAILLLRRGIPGRLVLATLVLAWCCRDAAVPAALSAAAAVALAAAMARGGLDGVRARLAVAVAWLAGAAALVAVASDLAAVVALLRSSAEQDGEVTWSMAAAAGAQAFPLVAAAVAVARSGRRPTPPTAAVLTALALGAAFLLWDQRSSERRGFEAGAGTAELRSFFAPADGAVLWVDEVAEAWFGLGRPAFFDALQGAPMLFSRDLALDWAARGAALREVGLARAYDLAPWGAVDDRGPDLVLTPRAVARFCDDPRRPAGLVAPGDQLGAVPPGYPALVWRPPFEIRRLLVGADELTWSKVAAFTALRCR